jgi:iron-sulfur cluster insertion protein
MITVSIKARIFIQSALEDQAKKYCFLSILSGGCNGLQYSIEFIDKIINNSTLVLDNLLIDDYSIEMLGNCKIDLQDELGYKKLVFINPDAKSSCSCGSSFSL